MVESSSAERTVAVVLTGAAARGAFQAGALAALIPALEERGLRPSIFLGTSAGAINAALWGSFAHLGSERAGRRVVDVWRTMNRKDVLRHPLVALVRDGVRLLPGSLVGRGPGLPALLDTRPLRHTAQHVFDPDRLERNVAEGVLDAVGVVATRTPGSGEPMGRARAVVFLDTTRPADRVADQARGVDVAPGRITADQVLASAAIPVAFPAMRLREPAGAAGWYVDGGVRLNAPLRPAVALGADVIVIVAADATDYLPGEPPAPDDEPWPDLADTGALMVHAVLADRMIEDLHALRQRNEWVRAGVFATSSTGRAYRPIDVIDVSPRPGQLGDMAEYVMHRKSQSRLRQLLTESDTFALARFLRGLGEGSGQRELLSYVLFDDDYFAAQIDLGRDAARSAIRRLDQSGGFADTQDDGERRAHVPGQHHSN